MWRGESKAMKTASRYHNRRLLNQPASSHTALLKLYHGVLTSGCTLGLLVAATSHSQAQTTVSGIIAGETWTAANSPYHVVGDVFITALTIQSNVVVQIDGNLEIEVAGLLQVNGTCGSPVLFTPQDKTKAWKGLLFRDAVPGSYFNGAIIEGAKLSAVRITNTSPAFTNCIIRNNSSPDFGGGILAHPAAGQTLILDGCIVSNNLANPTYGSGYGYGGGILVDGSMLLLQSTVVSNRTKGYYGYGGGVFAVNGNCTMQNCTIAFNAPNAQANDDAAGIYFDSTGTLQMNNCVVASNGLAGASAQFSGGGVLAYRGATKLINCLIVGNLHEGIYFRSGNGSIINSTVVYNENTHWGVYSYGATVGMTNSIVYYNWPAGVGGNVVSAYSDIEGGVQPGPGNISFSPALCPGSLSLIRGSPCIDAGSPNSSYNDACIDDTLCAIYSKGAARNDMGVWGGPGACFGLGPRSWCSCEAPTIVSQPRSQSSCLGQSVNLCVGASGSPPLAYQWWFKGSPLPGQTTNCLILGNLQASNAGPYAVVVSNSCGSITSAPVQLVVNDACVDICMYAGLNISGLAGRTYELRYTTDLANTNFATWAFLATNMTPWLYIDTNSCGSPKRFYGVKLLP